jgi:hypothetical protein
MEPCDAVGDSDLLIKARAPLHSAPSGTAFRLIWFKADYDEIQLHRGPTRAYENNVSRVDSSASIPVGGFQGWILEWFSQESTPGGLQVYVSV